MARVLPAGLTNLLASGYAETHSWLVLTTPGTNDPSLTYHLATASITIDGVPYQPSLRSTGAVKLSLTRAADRVEVEIENASEIFGPEFLRDRDKITGASVKFGRYWQDLDNSGATYSKQLLTGAVSGVRVSRDAIQLTLVSDLYATGSIGGNRLVARRCQWTFRDSTTCGYTGAELTCNKRLTDADGCSGRSNQHRYGGFVYIEPASTVTSSLSLSGPPANQLVKSTTGDSFLQRQFVAFTPEFGISDDAVNEQTEITITGWYNVKAYGATGDGATNDTTAVQAAIDAAESAGGGTVYFPPGTYLVSQITGADDVNLVGAGKTASIIKSNGTNTSIVFFSATGSKVTVRDLQILGSGSGTSQHGLNFDHTSVNVANTEVHNVWIKSCGGIGLRIKNVFSGNFRNVEVDLCGDHAIDILSGGPTLNFYDCYVHQVADNKTAYRIRSGHPTFINCNGVDGSGTGRNWALVGQRSGAAADETSTNAAFPTFINCNIESWSGAGIFHREFSTSNIIACEFVLSTTGTAPIYYEGTIQRYGLLDAATVFANSDDRTQYLNDREITSVGPAPVLITGRVGSFGAFAGVTDFYNSTTSRNEPLRRADGVMPRIQTSSSYTIPKYTPSLIDVRQSAPVTITLGWAGDFEAGTIIEVKDGAGVAATHNITVSASGGSSIDGGGSVVINSNYSSLRFVSDATDWFSLGSGSSAGDVAGPGSSTDNAVARFDSTTGKVIQNSSVTIDDSGHVTGGNYTSSGYFQGTDTFLDTYSASASVASTVYSRRHRGSSGSPTAVQSGDVLGYQAWQGQYDSTPGNRGSGAYITVAATENWSSTANGGKLSINATPNGSTDVFAKGVRIDPTAASWEPTNDADMDLGSSSVRWRDLRINRTFVASGTTPSANAGTGAGTGPTLTLADTPTACYVDLTTGTSPATSAKVFDITLSATAPNYYMAWLQPANAAAAALSGTSAVFVDDAAAANNKVTVNVGAGGLTASTQYLWYLFIVAV